MYLDLKCNLLSAAESAKIEKFEVLAWLEQHGPDLAVQFDPVMHSSMVELLNKYCDEDSICDVVHDYDEAMKDRRR